MRLNSVKPDNKTSFKILINPLLAVIIGSAFVGHANASTLISSTEYLDYEWPANIQEHCYERENCPEIEIEYIKTNHDWINKIVNARINSIVINGQPNESAFNKADSKQEAKAAIDDFIVSQLIDFPEGTPWRYNFMVQPDYLGHADTIETFEINAYIFNGGAHGSSFSEYLIFDPSSKTQIKLADMLQKDSKPYFEALAYDAYQKWVATLDEDVDGYENNWPFILSDNVTLTDKGVDIRYQHYAIGPYAYGMPVLSIPYSKLDGILKPRFLSK